MVSVAIESNRIELSKIVEVELFTTYSSVRYSTRCVTLPRPWAMASY